MASAYFQQFPRDRVLEGVFYVLRTGIQWKALPKEYGTAQYPPVFQRMGSASGVDSIHATPEPLHQFLGSVLLSAYLLHSYCLISIPFI
jgi:hypothetical protein